MDRLLDREIRLPERLIDSENLRHVTKQINANISLCSRGGGQMTIVYNRGGKVFESPGIAVAIVTQISQRRDCCVDGVEQKREEEKNETLHRAKHHITFDPHIEPENCTARETDSNQFFFLPLSIRPSLFSLSRSQMYPHRSASKRKYMYRSGRSLFVRDCETRFLRKRREKLQSRFVERFD